MIKTMISYAREDARHRDDIKALLQNRKYQGAFSVWDDTQIQPTENWRKKIIRSIKEADLFIPIITSSADCSQWVRIEVVAAQVREDLVVLPYNPPGSGIVEQLPDLIRRANFANDRLEFQQAIDAIYEANAEKANTHQVLSERVQSKLNDHARSDGLCFIALKGVAGISVFSDALDDPNSGALSNMVSMLSIEKDAQRNVYKALVEKLIKLFQAANPDVMSGNHGVLTGCLFDVQAGAFYVIDIGGLNYLVSGTADQSRVMDCYAQALSMATELKVILNL